MTIDRSRNRPRFDRPITTAPAAAVIGELAIVLAEQAPMPELIEPLQPAPVVKPADDPLVAVAHRRIRTLSNYWHAGWSRARPVTLMRAGAFERLSAVADSLPDRFGLAVFDAWRPLDLQAELFAAAYEEPELPPGFVSPPDPDPTTPPPHLTGGTVDLTLTIEGIALAPGGGYDDFTDRAHADHLEAVGAGSRGGSVGGGDVDSAAIDRSVRRMLFWAMREQGFVVLQQEWWHFEFGTRRWAAITGNDPLYGPAHVDDR